MQSLLFAVDWIQALPDWVRPSTVGGSALWAVGLMWAFSPQKHRLMDRLDDGLPFDPLGILSSLIGTLPFIGVAAGIVWLTDLTLGQSWGASLGLLMCVSSGVYELGRVDSANRAERLLQDKESIQE